MMMKRVILAAAIFAAGLSAQAVLAGKKKTLPSEAEYQAAPFGKVINPAFADDMADKRIKVEVSFVSINEVVMDLPEKYQDGWVRMIVISPGDPTKSSSRIVVRKEDSDIVFELKTGERIDLFAKTVLTRTQSAATGRSQKDLLFEAEKIVKPAKKTPAASDAEPPKDAYVKAGDPTVFFVLDDDGSFHQWEGTQEILGNYKIKGKKIVFSLSGGQAETCSYQVNKITCKTDVYTKPE